MKVHSTILRVIQALLVFNLIDFVVRLVQEIIRFIVSCSLTGGQMLFTAIPGIFAALQECCLPLYAALGLYALLIWLRQTSAKNG